MLLGSPSGKKGVSPRSWLFHCRAPGESSEDLFAQQRRADIVPELTCEPTLLPCEDMLTPLDQVQDM